MSVEAKLDQILTNQATIITNQATILTHVDASGGGDGADIKDALATLEGQITTIQSTIGTEATPVVPPVVDPAPAPAPAAQA